MSMLGLEYEAPQMREHCDDPSLSLSISGHTIVTQAHIVLYQHILLEQYPIQHQCEMRTV